MKKILIACWTIAIYPAAYAQLGAHYDYTVQPSGNMQYFRPTGTNLFVGDCIPFFHDGVYYDYWLLDSGHHKSLHGLGGHQWVLTTTPDLKHWTQHPIVLGIDEEWEKSICTGSVVYHGGKFYAFYATRLLNNGKVNEQLSYAISADGIHFVKQKPNPFYTSAPGYSKRNFRDPKVFVDKDGVFHLFVASEQERPVLAPAAGCLVHLSSKDLKTWTVHEPVLTGQGSVPECPDYFFWKGWYYLVYSDNSNTCYVQSRNPYGPWKQPPFQALDEDWANVVKTAEFNGDRRIAAAWIPSRRDNLDDNGEVFGGNSVFREVLQEPDGTLDTRFPPEMIPATGADIPFTIAGAPGVSSATAPAAAHGVTLNDPNGVASAYIAHLPATYRLTCTIQPTGANEEYGFYLKADSNASTGYRLNFSAQDRMVSLGNTDIRAVKGLDGPITVDVIVKDDIIDVCIGQRRCIVNRTPGQKGDFLWLYTKHGEMTFSDIRIRPILKQ